MAHLLDINNVKHIHIHCRHVIQYMIIIYFTNILICTIQIVEAKFSNPSLTTTAVLPPKNLFSFVFVYSYVIF